MQPTARRRPQPSFPAAPPVPPTPAPHWGSPTTCGPTRPPWSPNGRTKVRPMRELSFDSVSYLTVARVGWYRTENEWLLLSYRRPVRTKTLTPAPGYGKLAQSQRRKENP